MLNSAFGDISIRSIRDLAIDGYAKQVVVNGELSVFDLPIYPYSEDLSWDGQTLASGLIAKNAKVNYSQEFRGWFKEGNFSAEDKMNWYHFSEDIMTRYHWNDLNDDNVADETGIFIIRYALLRDENSIKLQNFGSLSSNKDGCDIIPFGSDGNEQCDKIVLEWLPLQKLTNSPLAHDVLFVLSTSTSSYSYNDTDNDWRLLGYANNMHALYKTGAPSFVNSLTD